MLNSRIPGNFFSPGERGEVGEPRRSLRRCAKRLVRGLVSAPRFQIPWRKISPLLVSFFLAGCAPIPYLFLQYGTELKQIDPARVAAENPLGPKENIKMTALGQSQSASHYVVQIRDRESPHLHKTHDGTVVMIGGRGYLVMNGKRIELSPGDIVFIPRGIVHYYVNTGLEPTVAFVVFSPPFDGKDTVPVTRSQQPMQP